MSEKDMRREVIKLLKPIHPLPVENLVHVGTPDLNTIYGWVELKYARCWPARESTPLKLDHYTDQQRTWLMDRWNAGGCSHLLLQVRTEWFAFEAPAAMKVGFLTHQELKDTATHYSWHKPTSEQLCSWLQRK